MSEENKGNSAAVKASDSEDFFGKLEQSVNGMVADSKEAQPVKRNTKVTQRESGSNMATHNESQGSNVQWDNENNPYKKGIEIQGVKLLK